MRINGSVIFLVGKFGGSENSSYLCRRNDINSIGMCNYNIAMVKPHQQMLSKRLRGIAHAPKDFDYPQIRNRPHKMTQRSKR